MKKIFDAQIQEIPQILLWIKSHFLKGGMEKKAAQRIELALEEALVNIVLHGYKSQKGAIEVALREIPHGLEISLSDEGPPYDPLTEAPQADLSSSLEERKEGGLGIYFIKKIASAVSYRRENGANILTLSIHFSQMK